MRNALLIVIVFLAFVLRLYNLTAIPSGFHVDELANGYIGRYIILNGHDLANRPWPLDYSDKFDDYPPVIPMYLSALPTFALGVNEFAVRLPSAVFASLLVSLIYVLSNFITKNRRAALIAALFAAVLPWNIVLARTTSETSFGLVAFVLGLILIFKKRIGWSIPLFLFSYLLYPTFRTIIPLVFFGLIFFVDKTSKKLVVLGLILTIGATLLASQTIWGQARFKKISLLTDPSTVTRLAGKSEAYNFDEGANNVFVARAFHNKFITTGEEFVQNYFDYLSPRFLFFQGGLPDRVVVPEKGVLLIFIAFVICFGLILPHKNKYTFFFLYLLLISIIPAALTIDEIPSINRAAPMIIPLLVLSAIGANALLKLKTPKLLWLGGSVVFSVLLSLEFLLFLHYYFNHTASYHSFQRNDGVKEMAQTIISEELSGKKILATGDNWETVYYLFYKNDFSKKLTPLGKKLYLPKVNNVTFFKSVCSPSSVSGYDILITSSSCDAGGLGKDIKTILRKDQTAAYKVIDLHAKN